MYLIIFSYPFPPYYHHEPSLVLRLVVINLQLLHSLPLMVHKVRLRPVHSHMVSRHLHLCLPLALPPFLLVLSTVHYCLLMWPNYLIFLLFISLRSLCCTLLLFQYLHICSFKLPYIYDLLSCRPRYPASNLPYLF